MLGHDFKSWGVETHRGWIPPLRRCGCAAQRGVPSAAAMHAAAPPPSRRPGLLGVWRHTGVRFLLSGAAALLPSALCRLPPPYVPRRRPPSRRLGLSGVWRHTEARFLLSGAAAVLPSAVWPLLWWRRAGFLFVLVSAAAAKPSVHLRQPKPHLSVPRAGRSHPQCPVGLRSRTLSADAEKLAQLCGC